MTHMPINEQTLRDHIRAELTKQARDVGARLFEELQIERGAARVDLAVVGSELEAFEIKSDLDNFARMHNQIHAYNRVFDKITLVTGALHSPAVANVVPSWWGIIHVERMEDGQLVSHVLRAPLAHDRQEPLSLAMMLWRDEAVDILQTLIGQAVSQRATRPQLHQQLVTALSLTALRSVVAAALFHRIDQVRVNLPSAQYGGSSRPDANCLDFHFQL
jgi:hypothetical protein